RLFDPRYEREGCFLVPCEEAQANLPRLDGVHRSRRNGRGPWAWRRHWLVVILVDDLLDRHPPTTETLQALRLFANQATVALESVAQYEAQRYLAEHDALTKLRNRHSFMRELEAAVVHARGAREELTVVYCDLDAFKQLNDVFGHTTGDRALESFSTVLAESV